MAISLKKGNSFNLSKSEPALKKILVGLGWEMSSQAKMDLDVSVFMLGSSGKLPADEFFVFYNNLKSPDGSVQHTGDNRTGDDEGDDEMILANLALVSPQVSEILFVVTIHEAQARRHHFGLLQNAYIRIVDVENNREILRYDLDQDFTQYTDMEFGKLTLQNQDWHFTALGIGNQNGLQGFVDKYA
ncbi:TerD family protein [Hugenholtzia roseola]|uniref:TerD family protein n=1 Tax=Hugenholtzia roseola TaxID=1002 RepID=UPI00047CF4C8|nr:TerD family protein [Hugenholtzia roseola]